MVARNKGSQNHMYTSIKYYRLYGAYDDKGSISAVTVVAKKSKTLESIQTIHCGSAFEEKSFDQRREVFGQLCHRRNGVFDCNDDWSKRADILEIGLRFNIEGTLIKANLNIGQMDAMSIVGENVHALQLGGKFASVRDTGNNGSFDWRF